ncbi:MAG: hypothetical protein MZV70_19570 [Desulfobacterales bacterium]|nr:hypothetical protein [Desulfobacterales bacterium]
MRASRSPDSGRLRGKPALRPSSAAGRGGRAVRSACVIALNPAGAHSLRAGLRADARSARRRRSARVSRRSREASRTPSAARSATARMPARRRVCGDASRERSMRAGADGRMQPTRSRRLRLARRRAEPCRLAHANSTGRGDWFGTVEREGARAPTMAGGLLAPAAGRRPGELWRVDRELLCDK